MNIERRYYPATEIRTINENEPGLTGYAAVFNSMSEDLGGFREVILPGAFAQAVREDDVRALWNHDPNYVLGRNRSGTLTLSEDDHGLPIDVKPPDTQWARDLMVSIGRGDVTQMSFGFSVTGQRWEKEDGEDVRYLTSVRLFDVSPVTYPAYQATEVQARKIYEEARNMKLIPPEPTPGGGHTAVTPTRTLILKRKTELITLRRRKSHAS
jgi:hypothetical protein